MEKPCLVQFKPKHFDRIRLRRLDALAIEGIPNLRDRLIRAAEYAPAVSGLAAEGVMFSGGLLMLWPGVAEAWLLTSPLVEQYPVWFHRTSTRWLRRKQDAYQLRRIQMTVHCQNKPAKHWANHLGFVQEARMKKYGPQGHDYYLYARTS